MTLVGRIEGSLAKLAPARFEGAPQLRDLRLLPGAIARELLKPDELFGRTSPLRRILLAQRPVGADDVAAQRRLRRRYRAGELVGADDDFERVLLERDGAVTLLIGALLEDDDRHQHAQPEHREQAEYEDAPVRHTTNPLQHNALPLTHR